MNMCIYEPINGAAPKCNGVCKKGPDNYCPYYYVDPVWKIMNEWKKEAGIDSPIMWKKDHKRSKLCVYTSKPGFMIGKAGSLYEKYYNKLKTVAVANNYIQNGIDIIEVGDWIK